MYFFIFLQTKNDRSAFSDYKTISSMNWQDKNNVTQSSKFVVTVSNWHFNRNTLKMEKAPVCKLEHIMVTLKLASTVFEATEANSNSGGAATSSKSGEESPEKELGSPGAAAASTSGAVTSKTGETYTFDRNGAIIPYSAFVSLLDAPEFQKYLAQVKKQYRRDRPSSDENNADSASSSCEIEELDSTDEGAEAKARAFLARRKRRVIDARKKMLYSKVRKTIDFDSESENDIDGPPASQANEYEQSQLGVTPLPSADEDDEDNKKEESKDREAKEIQEGGKESEKKDQRKTRGTKQK